MSSPPPIGMSPAPPPPPPPPSSGKKGCLIAALVALGLLVVTCGGFFIYAATHPNTLMAWGVDKMRAPAMQSMAEDVPPELKQEFESEMGRYVEYLKTPDAKTRIQQQDAKVMAPFQLMQGALQDQRFTAEEVRNVVDALRQAPAAP